VNPLRLLRRLSVLALLVAVATGVYAYTAASAVPVNRAGDGSGAVTGYTATVIQYNLNATSPQNMDSVTITLNVAPVAGSTLKMQLASGGSWYSCTNSGASVTCVTTSPQATAVAATQLRLVIAD
jgi:hypothetical protein